MENLEEKQLSRELIYDGTILKAVKDNVLLPNGKEAFREFCLHVGAVCIIPITEDGRVVMERQFRYPYGRVFLEIPAGKLNYKGEDITDAALRELREETGATPGSLRYLGDIATSPALINERISLFLAEDLSFGERELDEDEFLNVEFIPLAQLAEACMKGEIEDAKTQIAVLKLARLKGV